MDSTEKYSYGVSSIPTANARHKFLDYASPKIPSVAMEYISAADISIIEALNRFYEQYAGRITREVADHTLLLVMAQKRIRIAQMLEYIANLSQHLDYVRTLGCTDSMGIQLISGLIDMKFRERLELTPSQQEAVMAVTKAMSKDNPGADMEKDIELRYRHDIFHLVLTDRELIQLAADNRHRVDQVVHLVSMNNTRPTQIRAVLDGSVEPVLSGGAL